MIIRADVAGKSLELAILQLYASKEGSEGCVKVVATSGANLWSTTLYNIEARIADAWGDYIEAQIDRGWQPFLLTFMFEQLPGSQAARMAQMAHFLESV